MRGTLRIRRAVGAAVLTAVAVALAACGDASGTSAGDQPGETPVGGDLPITQRAIAAIALDHLPGDSSARYAQHTDQHSPEGGLGARLRYHADGEYDGDLVEVFLAPEQPQTRCRVRCERRAVEGGTLTYWWGPAIPENEIGGPDPGGFGVTLRLDDQVVSASYYGVSITDDPRSMGIDITPEMLEAVVTDPRLRLTTSAAALEAGEALADWGGGEPDPESYRLVNSDAESLAVVWRWWLGKAGDGRPDIRSVTASPVVDELGLAGERQVSARVTVAPTRKHPYSVVDLVVSEKRPSIAPDSCASSTFDACRSAMYGANETPTFLLWNPGPDGEFWVVYQREDAYLTARLSGWDIPAQWDRPLISDVDWDGLSVAFSDDEYFGFTTTQRYADQAP